MWCLCWSCAFCQKFSRCGLLKARKVHSLSAQLGCSLPGAQPSSPLSPHLSPPGHPNDCSACFILPLAWLEPGPASFPAHHLSLVQVLRPLSLSPYAVVTLYKCFIILVAIVTYQSLDPHCAYGGPVIILWMLMIGK